MSAPPLDATDRPARHQQVTAMVIAAVLVLGAATFLGYRVGARHETSSHTLVGRAYVGASQAGVRVGSWSYTIPTTGGAVDWFDADGDHEGGTAPCLRTPGTYAWVQFGYAVAHGPDDISWRQVTWVRCVAHP